jgi:hypothetical protein
MDNIFVNTTQKLSDCHDTFSEENDLDDESNELLNEAYEFKNGIKYQNLTAKQLKELREKFRINKTRKMIK